MDRIERIRQSFITRKTENTDTRDDIVRHDPDYHKNKNAKQSTNHWEDHEEDMTEISVESLIIFLEGLKKNNNSDQITEKPKVDSAMKKALSAYGAQSQKPQKRYTYLDNDEQNVDIHLVHHLIQSLKVLLKNNITDISLIEGDGFLESIRDTLAQYDHIINHNKL